VVEGKASSICIKLPYVMQVFTAGACSPDEPGPGCPCKLEELAPFGACLAGYQCAAHSELGHTSDTAQHSRNISAGVCVPCSLGQYCPKGAVLPLPGSPEASQYVAKYACRSGSPLVSEDPVISSVCAINMRASDPHKAITVSVHEHWAPIRMWDIHNSRDQGYPMHYGRD